MWKNKVVSPEEMLAQIEPGMTIFLGTGMAEPRTLVKHLMESNQDNLQDLELIQLVSLGDAVAIDARYARSKNESFADTAFIVDESYQGKGIASYLFELLIRIAREEGVAGFKADVLANNKAMLKVYEKSPYPVHTVLSEGVYKLTITFK